MIGFPNKVCLTFDVEDFINDRSLEALFKILMLLRKRNQKGLFFITGHMAEKLLHFPKIVHLLEEHEIGYHSTSHSVRPAIFEYTDVESYQEAYQTSLSREVAHIDPLSGAIGGRGGIELLRDMFPHKRIQSFRAPGLSWSPPHLEALAHLGIKYDFSTNVSSTPASYRQITFFPYPSFIDSVPIRRLLNSIRKKEVTILDFHPSFFVNKDWWDSAFFSRTNVQRMSGVASRTMSDLKSLFHKFDMRLKAIDFLSKLRLAELFNEGTESETELDLMKIDIAKVYRAITKWPMKRFNYKPRFIRSHLRRFFGSNGSVS